MTTEQPLQSTPSPHEHPDVQHKDKRANNRFLALLVVVVILLVSGGMILWLSIARYMGYNSGMLDLGNMAQAIGSVQRGEPLVSTYGTGSMSRLGLHVELIYFLIAPFYALWSDPRLLLIIQAGLYVLGALPVYWLALRRGLPWLLGCFLIVLYLFYPVAMTGVLFDFHGDTLAMPLVLFTIDALDRRSWRRYALFVVLALSCKVYVALPIALIGVMAWWIYGERRVGLLTLGSAIIYGLVAFLVIRPLFTTAQTPQAQSGLNYLTFYFGDSLRALQSWRIRQFHATVVFGPALLLSLIGWEWLLASLVIGIPVVLSTGPGPSYAYWFHHYALVVPFIVMATIFGASRIAGAHRGPKVYAWRRWAAALAVIAITLFVLYSNRKYVDTPLNPKFWHTSGLGLDDLAYGRTSRDAVKDSFLATNVPPLVPLAASPYLAAHLTNRSTILLTREISAERSYPFASVLPKVDAVLPDALFDNRGAGGADAEAPAITQVMADPAFALVAARDGLLLFERNTTEERQLLQRIDQTPTPADGTSSASHDFGNTIRLVDAHLKPLDNGRVRAVFSWMLLTPSPPPGHLMAVSRLEGIDGARIVHLPTYALKPVSQWKAGQVVHETFDIQLPPGVSPGKYIWRTGWYDLTRPWSYLTDDRSRLPGTQELPIATLDISQP